MRVLEINGVFEQGSTGAIVKGISAYLKENNVDVSVCYGIGKREDDAYKFCYRYEQALYRRVARLFCKRYTFAPVATFRLKRYIRRYKPDVVHLHSINGNCVNIVALLQYLKRRNIVTVITNHAEFFYTGNCTSTLGCEGYTHGCINCMNKPWATDNSFYCNTGKAWLAMKDGFNGFKPDKIRIVSVSPFTKKAAERSPIMSQYRHTVVLNGIDTTIFTPRREMNIRQKYGISDNEKIALFVTSAFSQEKEHIKGGWYLVEIAKMLADKHIRFIVLGNLDMPQIPGAENIIFAGRTEDKITLANFYSQADLLLMLSRSETFGMTGIEAQCCGLPVVGFRCGGAETVLLSDYATFFPYGDLDSVKEMVLLIINQKLQYERQEIAEIAQEHFSVRYMARQYYLLYFEMTRGKSGSECGNNEFENPIL